MARICSIAGDPTLLRTRERMLKSLGHSVTSYDYREGQKACASGTYDLLLLGQRIPRKAKLDLISTFREANPHGRVIAFARPGESRLANVDVRVYTGDPDDLMRAIVRTVGPVAERRRAARAQE